jgi:hypothetical protein
VGNKKGKKRKSPQFVVQIRVVVQYLRENWAILANKKPKKRKSPQYVVEIKVVGQYLRKNWAILGNKKAKKSEVWCSKKGVRAIFA